eukprot:TRINITY_DN8676_c1_g2_i1.p1 TRINITY_DN8676_c1_g2~~TRINITY_DN8676_c1_g2_i1.p1  ORF type:complete len:692 (-),score=129.77 TRINITY_DN8676_c1_g2_i1:118-2193(-)
MFNLVVLLINAIILTNSYTLYGCGSNSRSQLGISSTATPTPIFPSIDAIDVSSGEHHTIVLDSTGRVHTFGNNEYYQLGHNGTGSKTPEILDLPFLVSDIFTGDYNTFLVSENGELYGFGLNLNGQLGIGNFDDHALPTLIDFNHTAIVNVQATLNHTLVLDDNNTLYGIGSDKSAQLGGSYGVNMHTPVILNYNTLKIAAGDKFSLFLLANNTLYGMGTNNFGQLGKGFIAGCSSPCVINTSFVVGDICAGLLHTIILDSTEHVYSMGNNQYLQLGHNGGDKTVPTQIEYISNITAIRCNNLHTLIMDQLGTIFSFGYQTEGRLCLGTPNTPPSPTEIFQIDDGTIEDFIAGGQTSFFLVGVAKTTTVSKSSSEVDGTTSISSYDSLIYASSSSSSSDDDEGYTIEESLSSSSLSLSSTEVSSVIDGEFVVIEEDYEGVFEEDNKDLLFKNGDYKNITTVTVSDSTVTVQQSIITIIDLVVIHSEINMENSDIFVDNHVNFGVSSIILSDSHLIVSGNMSISNSIIKFSDGATLSINGCLVIDGPTTINIDATSGIGEIISYDCIVGDIDDLNITVYNADTTCETVGEVSDSALSTVFVCDQGRGNWWVYLIVGVVLCVLILFLLVSVVAYKARIRESINLIRKRQKDVDDNRLVMDSLKNLKCEIAITQGQFEDLEELVNEQEFTSSCS